MLEVFSEELINELKNYYIDDNNSIKSKSLWLSSVCKLFPEFKETFYNNFNSTQFREVMYCILNDINEVPKCKNINCNNDVHLRNYVIGFQQCCCKQCLAEYQKQSDNFKTACSIGAKRHHKKIHKKSFIDVYDYDMDGNYFNIHNYCNHGDIKIYKKTAFNIHNIGQSSFCMKCNEEIFLNYIPSNDEIEEFQNKFQTFYQQHSHNMKWDWWIMYYPKQLKIIISYFEKYVEKYDKNNTDLLECYYQFLHDLKGRPKCCECDKEVSFCHSGINYRKFCDDHLYGFNKSSMEHDLNAYIDSLNVKYILNENSVIDGELDIYFPNHNFAIEFNGCWWHCDKFKDKKYHYNKWKQCKDNGIQLMFIWEDDWINKNDIIKSLIKSKLGIYKNRIYARNCEIKEVDPKDEKEFITKYHLQGYTISTYRLGLYYNNELISIMTFGKTRFKSNDFEIIRYCCKSDYQIIGGANKLFTNFKRMYHITNIISYADADISNGHLYKTLGMTEIGITESWKWLYRGERYNRLNKIRFTQTDLFKCYSAGTIKYIFK